MRPALQRPRRAMKANAASRGRSERAPKLAADRRHSSSIVVVRTDRLRFVLRGNGSIVGGDAIMTVGMAEWQSVVRFMVRSWWIMLPVLLHVFVL